MRALIERQCGDEAKHLILFCDLKKKKRGLLPFLPNATIFDPSTQIIHRLVFIQVAQFRFINSSLNSIGIRFF